mgnify:CR=1 FL=1
MFRPGNCGPSCACFPSLVRPDPGATHNRRWYCIHIDNTRHAAEVSPIQPDVGDRITYRIDGKGPLKVGYVLKLLRYGELSVGTERQVMLDKLVS